MNDLIQIAAVELANFLAAHLPALGKDWWTTHVEARLSVPQQRRVRERDLTTLGQLDFAALLRVLDQSWHELSQALDLPREGRTWVKELQTVRNRWAHLSAQTIAPSEVYRDADTLGRFLDMLGATPESLTAVETRKTAALDEMAVARGAVDDPPAHAVEMEEPADERAALRDGAASSVSPETMFQRWRRRGGHIWRGSLEARDRAIARLRDIRRRS